MARKNKKEVEKTGWVCPYVFTKSLQGLPDGVFRKTIEFAAMYDEKWLSFQSGGGETLNLDALPDAGRPAFYFAQIIIDANNRKYYETIKKKLRPRKKKAKETKENRTNTEEDDDDDYQQL